jgi:hypothetical protein
MDKGYRGYRGYRGYSDSTGGPSMLPSQAAYLTTGPAENGSTGVLQSNVQVHYTHGKGTSYSSASVCLR